VFAVHRIDEQLTKAMDRKVWLPSGGTLVIDRTEAMTVVDVNTGKFTGSGGNLEQTVTRNNLEAAEEIVRQLRLRDIGGIVVIDFIDMVLESNRDLVLRRLTEALARDRTRHQVSEVTSLGLVQLTRKRLGTGLIEAFSTQCPHCAGRGILLHGDPVDTIAATARKSETGGRRGKRGKRGAKPEEEVPVAKVPTHHVGEHPMFKAMAAANGRHEGEDGEEGDMPAEDVAELDPETIREAVVEGTDEELEDEDFDESDEDETDDDESDDEDSDEDEIDLDADEEDDEDDDIEVINGEDSEDSDEDDDDDDEDVEDVDSDEDDEDSDDEDSDDDDDFEDDEESAPVTAPGGRHRRRAAARPAGPPVHGS
jgi:ribonuclease E